MSRDILNMYINSGVIGDKVIITRGDIDSRAEDRLILSEADDSI